MPRKKEKLHKTMQPRIIFSQMPLADAAVPSQTAYAIIKTDLSADRPIAPPK